MIFALSGQVSEAVEPTSSPKAEKLDAAGVARMDYRDTCSEGSDEEEPAIATDSAVLTECEDSDAEFERCRLVLMTIFDLH